MVAKIKIILFTFLVYSSVSSQIMWQFKKDTVVTWYYSDGDEFNGTKINAEYWNYWYGWARSIFGNKEQQYYTDGKNHLEKDGLLRLYAKKENITARMIDHMKDDDTLKNNSKFYSLNKTSFKYSSGMLQSKKEFLYGYYECRFKLPQQKGYWPAFWLYGGFPNQEIDMMECKSEKPSQIHIDTHCEKHCDYLKTFLKKESFGGWVNTRAEFKEGYNVASCEWTPEYVKFYLNGEFIGISKVSFQTPKHIVLDIAVPSNNGPFGPGPDPKDTSMAFFDVDYVRVWNKTRKAERQSLSEKPGIITIAAEKNYLRTKFLRKRKKVFYGDKKYSKNEGFFVSVFQKNAQLQLLTNGAVGKNYPVLEIRDAQNNLLETRSIDRTYLNINTSNYPKGSLSLKVKWEKMEASCNLE